MIATDPWAQVLESFEPEYKKLKEKMERTPKIRIALRKVNLAWRIRIEEDWDSTKPEDLYMYYTADYGNLDSRCDWSADQLNDWKLVNRLSYQEWKFWRLRDAEKFLTLFNLKWADQ